MKGHTMRRLMLTCGAALLLAVALGGCGSEGLLRFRPSEEIRENMAVAAAASERLETLTDTQDTVTPAMGELAEAVATGTQAAQAYIGLPSDTSALDTVSKLVSDDAEQRAEAQAAVEATATAAATEGAKRPTATDVIDQVDKGSDALLDSIDPWLALFGLGGTAAAGVLEVIRRKKNEAIAAAKTTAANLTAALTTTVRNVEQVADQMPDDFYRLQAEKLDQALKEIIAAVGGSGPVATPAAPATVATTLEVTK